MKHKIRNRGFLKTKPQERETQPQRPAEVRGFDFRPVEWCGSVGSCKDTPEVFWLRQGLPPLNSPENFIFWAPPLWTRASCVFQSSWRAWQANSTDHSVPERLYVRAAEAKAEACSLSRTCWLTGSLADSLSAEPPGKPINPH
ncbi:uncharacterized protein [Ovis canadensis]|uniref:uncharacterized protein isoform X6 n=1 Tax=Ovis canadensis TaxID=37174 RepID=UPI0037520C2E